MNSQFTQQGSMLVIALFVIVVLALLGVTITRLLSASSDTIIHEVLGQRALNAARTGIELKVVEAFPISGTENCTTPIPVTPFSNIPGLENCQFEASCSETAVADGSLNQTYYQFSSTGQCSAGDIVVSRTVFIDAMN